MNNSIAIYGFTEEQLSLFTEHMPDGYFYKKYDEAVGLIGTHCICSIICSEGIDTKSREFLDSFYLDVGENADEQVIWIDSQTKPPELEGVYFHYNSLSKLLPELKMVLERAQKHYTVQQMYCGAYAFLPKLGIEEMLEEELWEARKNKYGREPEIFKRVRQEWTAVLEVDAITELAAVYEFAVWLKHNKHPYRLGGTAVCGKVPYLLGIHDVNPLPPHLYCPECQKVIWKDDYKDGFDIPPEVCPECGSLMHGDGHNLVWQEYASYGRVPTYVFYLPNDMQQQIVDWLDNHWLRKYIGDQWEAAQPYEDHLARGNMLFRFELDRDEISPDFYSIKIDANNKADLIQMATNDEYYHRNPYPKDMGELLTQLGFRKTIWKEDEVARNILLQNKISWRNIPSCREEVFFYLKEHDFIDKDAFRGLNYVRKGKGLPVVTEDMRTAEDYWKVDYFNQIDWMPSRAVLLQRLFFELKSQIKDNHD
ncbi:MAG: hypothetical protein J6Q30_00270 [Oscillospiraceae bacterium]|nr:hypothetical protein [Oscillospiraceae bacterium]